MPGDGEMGGSGLRLQLTGGRRAEAAHLLLLLVGLVSGVLETYI